jgi:hypothetical protein
LTSPYTLSATLTLDAQWTTNTTSTTLSLNVSTRTYGDEDDVVYTVSVAGTSPTPTGTVSIMWGSTTLCTITLVSGGGHCSASYTALPVGSQSIYASYSGDSSHTGSVSAPQSLNITKDNSHTTVSESASKAAVGSEGSVLFTATVSSSNGESIPAGDGVTIHVGSASCATTTNGSGSASCSIANSALGTGTFSVSATYAGDSNINASSSSNTVNLTVGLKPVFSSATSTSDAVGHFFSFTVTASGSPTFAISGTLPHGVTFNTSSGVLSGTPSAGTIGTYSVTIIATNTFGSTNQTFTLNVT